MHNFFAAHSLPGIVFQIVVKTDNYYFMIYTVSQKTGPLFNND